MSIAGGVDGKGGMRQSLKNVFENREALEEIWDVGGDSRIKTILDDQSLALEDFVEIVDSNNTIDKAKIQSILNELIRE